MRADEVIIFSDMDGTLLTDWSLGPLVPQNNLDAIKKFIAAGGMFSIASGRQFGETLKYFESIELSVPTVQGNGAVIYDSVRGLVHNKIILPERVKLECLEYRDRTKGLWLAAADEFNIYQIESHDKDWDASINDLRRKLISVEEYMSLDLVKTCYVIADQTKLGSIAADIQKFETVDMFRVTQSSPVFLEILEKSVGKASGVAQAVKLAGAEGRTLVCIGDYDNDIDMLSLADIAACPSNSSPRVLEMADIVTCSNNEGAIADLIRLLDLEES